MGNSVKDDSGIHSAGDMGLVDFSSLNWVNSSSGGFYYALFESEIVALSSTKYKNIGMVDDTAMSASDDKTMSIFKNGLGVRVKDSSLGTNNPTDGKLAYELADGASADEYALVVEEVGKNLLDTSNFKTTTLNGVTAVNNGGTITLSGTATANTTFVLMQANSFNGGYKLTGCPSGGNYNTSYCMLVYNGSYNPTMIDIGSGATGNIDDTYKSICIFVRNGYSCNNLVFKPMLSKDLSATYDDFQPFQSKTAFIPLAHPLYGIGDLKDEVVKIDGKWYERNYFAEVDLGTLVYSKDSSKGYFASTNLQDILPIDDANIIPNILCDKYVSSSANRVYAFNESAIAIRVRMVWIRDDSVSDAASLKTLLNGVKLIYPLATPTLTEITDQTTLYHLESYKDKTYIDTTDGLATLDLDYGMSDVSATALNGERLGNLAVAMAEKKFNELSVAMLAME